jgi:hypothetical protein
MDDFNKRMQQAGREAARTQQARVEADIAERQAARDAEEPPEAPSGTGRLVLERRQGEWRYYLGAHRIRGGDAVELYVDARVGWIRGRFQWGRRNTSPPSIRVRTYHPDDPTVFLGELDVSLPQDAICRWPSE